MKKENLPLLIGLLIPLLMIIFVMVSVYVPTLLTQPKCNFVYASGGDYYILGSYAVQSGKLIKNEVKYPDKYPERTPIEPKLYICDVVSNTTREISFEEAQRLNLSSAQKSPDGFEISSGSEDYSIFSLFFQRGGYYGDKYIRGHGIAKRLNLHKEDGYWYHNYRFIGWVI
ncbi:MAG: hypothetical protein PHV55_09070 [Candidatus Omnitrophica bacterium]|nr:hypothetical protein [Candidatus Omnitrophota bacterium]